MSKKNSFNIFFLLSIILILYLQASKYNLMKELLIINLKNSKDKILFHPYIGCGFANKIPALTSSFFLSILSYHTLVIVNWNQLLYYFSLSHLLFRTHLYINNTKTFNRKNYTVLGELENGYSIKIYTYHSFLSFILMIYNISSKLKKYIDVKKNIYKNIEAFLQSEFLKPKSVIMKYINQFKSNSMKWNIIGVHIRTGYLSDFGEKDKRFFNNSTIGLYFNLIDSIIYNDNKSKVFIVSDSSLIKNIILEKYKRYIYNFSMPGSICHASHSMHSSKKIDQCVVKLIGENYLLSECKLIIGSNKSTYFGMACNRRKIKCKFI